VRVHYLKRIDGPHQLPISTGRAWFAQVAHQRSEAMYEDYPPLGIFLLLEVQETLVR
jgi:hypothetical protein